MDTQINNKASISDALDGELSKAQLDALLVRMRQDHEHQMMQTWSEYHYIGDVLRSEDLDVPMSRDFSQKLMARLDAEPVLLAPNATKAHDKGTPQPSINHNSRYMAITSIAAALMVAFVMAPQIISTINQQGQSTGIVAKTENNETFGANIKLASNSSVPSVGGNPMTQSAATGTPKDIEFAPKLEDQVEMLRDPRLDSYLQAHQKVSPTLESGARHIQKANVVPTPNEK